MCYFIYTTSEFFLMAAKLLTNGLIQTHDTSTKRKGELIHEKELILYKSSMQIC